MFVHHNIFKLYNSLYHKWIQQRRYAGCNTSYWTMTGAGLIFLPVSAAVSLYIHHLYCFILFSFLFFFIVSWSRPITPLSFSTLSQIMRMMHVTVDVVTSLSLQRATRECTLPGRERTASKLRLSDVLSSHVGRDTRQMIISRTLGLAKSWRTLEG